MKTTSALVRLVIFAIVTMLATGVLATTIGNFGLGSETTYTALFSDVTGLLKGDDVRIAGVRVGQVGGISVKDRTLAEVRFDVDSDQRLTTSTRAVIRYRNLVGQRYVALVDGAGDGTRLGENAQIPLERTKPALDLTVLFNGFKPLFRALNPADVNKLAFEIVRTLQGEGGTINGLLSRTASLTSALADRDQLVGSVVDNLNTVLGTVDERDQRLSELILQLQRFMSGLSADRRAIGASLVHIDDLAAQTAGLVRDARPSLRTDIDRLGDLAGNLDRNKKAVEDVVQNLPTKLNEITRTATYGSWFNFYVCDFDGKIVVPAIPELGITKRSTTYVGAYSNSAARCHL